METYISILRGINVSGHKKILMADLKTLYTSIDLVEPQTYIQSGNVIFKINKKESCKQLAEKIEKAIAEKYNFQVPVLVLSVQELQAILDSNPFLIRAGIDIEKLHITFLEETPNKNAIEKLELSKFLPDECFIHNKQIYLYCPGGYGNTKLSNTFFESKLKVKATTRNLKTANTLLKLADA
jgi:uncharacterized protein (DUF1697 family)